MAIDVKVAGCRLALLLLSILVVVVCYCLLLAWLHNGLDLDASVCVWVDGVCRELVRLWNFCVVLAAPTGRVRPSQLKWRQFHTVS